MATRRRSADLADHRYEHIAARELGRLAVVAPPWVGWVAVLVIGLVLRREWPGPSGAAAVLAAGMGLALMDLYLTHHRRGFGRYLAALTSVLAGGWLAWVTAAGIGAQSAQARVWLVGGGLVAACWSHWLHVHEGGDEAGAMTKPFGRAALKAGFDGVKLIKAKVISESGAVSAEIDHPGITHANMLRGIPDIEASWRAGGMRKGLPANSIVATPHPDDAGRSKVVIADPRVLDKPIPWPGPSRPGGSIAEPIRVGIRRDGSVDERLAHGYHEQVMAISGAGKTMGCMFNEVGETITRRDAFVIAADLGKGSQFLGPLAPALHYLARTPEEFETLLEAVNLSLLPRTEFLGDQHLGHWRQGCGLMHGLLWIEEASDAFAELEGSTTGVEDYLFPLLRKARSAGWRVVYSLHRASYDQMPTFLRDMVSLTTMGVRNESHARFGLSDVQAEAECAPHRWADDPEHQGKYYRDAKGMPKAYRTMEGRFYSWGDDTRLMAAHAAQYPVSARPLDAVTAPVFAKLLGRAEPPQPARGPAPQRPAVTLTSAATKEATMVASHEDDDGFGGFEPEEDPFTPEERAAAEGVPLGGTDPAAGPQVPVSAEVAVDRVRRQVEQWRAEGGVPGRMGHRSDTITIPDLRPLQRELGKSRSWLYTVMPRLEAEQQIRRTSRGWRILAKAA